VNAKNRKRDRVKEKDREPSKENVKAYYYLVKATVHRKRRA